MVEEKNQDTYVLVGRDKDGVPGTIQMVGGPFFQNELDEYKEMYEQEYPDFQFEVVSESLFRQLEKPAYEAAFKFQPFYYVSTFIQSLDYLPPSQAFEDNNVIYNKFIHIFYDEKKEKFILNIGTETTGYLGAKVMKDLTEYIDGRYPIELNIVFHYSPQTNKLFVGEAAGKISLLENPVSWN